MELDARLLWAHDATPPAFPCDRRAPPCRLTALIAPDGRWLAIQHGDNSEAVYQLGEADRDRGFAVWRRSVYRRVESWCRLVHAYESGQRSPAAPDRPEAG